MDSLPLISDDDRSARVAHAILFPARCVRRQALRYLSQAVNPPETVMPRVIEAIEQYGRDQALGLLFDCEKLPQSEATVAWLCAELDREWPVEDVKIDNYCCELANILSHTPIGLLRKDMIDLRCFPAELKPGFVERFALATLGWEELLSQLVGLGEDIVTRKYLSGSVRHRVGRIVEAMARHADKADAVLAFLAGRQYPYEGDLAKWLTLRLIAIAGAMRLEEAILALVPRLGTPSSFLEQDEARDALRAINGDSVARGVVGMLWSDDVETRMNAYDVLVDVHSDAVLDDCWRAFNETEDDYCKWRLAELLLNSFELRAVEAALTLMKQPSAPTYKPVIFDALLTAIVVVGVKTPEFDDWLAEAKALERPDLEMDEDEDEDGEGSLRQWYDEDPDRTLSDYDIDEWDEHIENLRDDDAGDEEDWDNEDYWSDGNNGNDDEGEDEWQLDDEEDWENDEDFDRPIRLIRGAHDGVGRNNPCPCGSGKKYKNCCMRQDEAASVSRLVQDQSIGVEPQASLVRLGPDDRRTTRIIATVIPRLNTKPIRREWNGKNLSFSNKVRSEIRDFFEKYDMPVPNDSGANIGCPHQAGTDYPVGGDCPHCAFWKGKQ